MTAIPAGPSGRAPRELTPVRIDGPAGTLAGWTAGDRAAGDPPVVLLHPINTRGAIWADLAAHLAPSRALLMPDLRAHGDSDAEGDLGLDPWLDDIDAFLDGVGLDRPFHVVGGSLGGSLAVCLAGRRPGQVMSVAGVGSALSFPALAQAEAEGVGTSSMFDELGVEGAFRAAFTQGAFGPGVPDEVVERGIALANPNDAATVKRVWSATVTSDSTARAARVRVPALVVTGELDSTCTPALGLEMARALGSEQVLMPGIGHLPMLEAPERLARLLEPHLARAETVWSGPGAA